MSTQDGSLVIPFSYSHVQSPIRLLELPPALLSLLSEDPAPILKIKALPVPTSSTATPAASSAAHHAVLCTPTQTFSLRHVHSSNSVLLLKPSPPSLISPDSEDDLQLSGPGVIAVSTAASYLELIPTIPDAKSLLRGLLPLYHGWDEEDGAEDFKMLVEEEEKKVGKDCLKNEVPVSDGEFETAWRDIVAFELDGVPHRPAPASLLKALSQILICSTAESLSLYKPFTIPTLVSILDEPDIPSALISAIISKISTQFSADDGDERWVLDQSETVSFVGRTLLEDAWEQSKGTKTKSDMLYISFMTRWKKAVPEESTCHCKLDLIKGWYTHPTQNTIRFVPNGKAEETSAAAPSTSAPPVVTAKNKWHEKFKKGKK